MRLRSIVLFVLKLVLSAALLGLVLAKVDAGAIVRTLEDADPWLVALWYASTPLANWLQAWRWTILAPRLSFSTAHKYTWIGLFFSQLLPGSISGDIAKGVSLALKENYSRTGLAMSIIAEKVIGLAALMLVFDVACAIVYALYGAEAPRIRQLALTGAALTLLCLFGACMLSIFALRGRIARARAPEPVVRLAEGVAATAKFYVDQPSLIVRSFGISLLIHAVYIVGTYFSLRALHIDAGFLFAAIVYPVLAVILLVPISISGIGVRDATLAALFSLFGISLAHGVALSWLALLAAVPNIAIGGAIQLWEMYRRR